MKQSVYNNALWKKLSEIENRFEKLFEMQKTLAKKREYTEIKSDLKELKEERFFFNFRFFKVRKRSFVIVTLGLQVVTLTVFCLKQQNDYVLLTDEYSKKCIILKESSEVETEYNLKP